MDQANIQAELLLPENLCSFETVAELEEPLDHRLIKAGAGEVTGGGIGSGWYRFDLALVDYDTAVELLTEWAKDLGIPEGSCLRRKGDRTVTILVREGET